MTTMTQANEVISAMAGYLQSIKTNYVLRAGYDSSIMSEEKQEFLKEYHQKWLDSLAYKISAKYIKISVNGSVHSFIMLADDSKFKAGDVLKAASWNTPARNFARGNVLVPESYKNVSWTGA